MSNPSSPISADNLPPIQRPKSPPLAFEKTPNDSLQPRISSPQSHNNDKHHSTNCGVDGGDQESPSAMGRLSLSANEAALKLIVEQQRIAIKRLHEAFEAEKQVWMLEESHLHQRIASLEQLLKSGDHHSPAKSPVISPTGDIVSPTSRALATGNTLPTIAEDENIPPLSFRRDGAPQSIDIPRMGSVTGEEPRRTSLVSFANEEDLKVEEIPPGRTLGVSPPPPMNRMLAGHTPVRAPPRPLTPPPQNMALDGIEDTPTRNNTHINTLLTQDKEEDGDVPLKGPLNMPELAHEADENNFTLEALTKRLEQIEKHPEQSKPMVFAQPSPGLASPVSEKNSEEISPASRAKSENGERPFAPMSTHMPQSHISSNALSPSGSSTMSPQELHEAKVQEAFEQGGIKLKKKSSTNFGAPFGSLGFGSRKLSHDNP